MKTNIVLFGLLTGAVLTQAAPPQTVVVTPAAPQPPPPVVLVGAAAPQLTYVYEQKPAPGIPPLVTAQQAQTIVEKFKEGYAKLNSPRFLIYVNRDLVDEKTGMKPSSRTVHVESYTTNDGKKADGANGKATTQRTTGDVAYSAGTAAEQTLADRQTVRDVERLFGRPLRLGGATLTDQRVATQLMADKSLSGGLLSGETEQARKDRAAVAKVADVVLEVLISSRQVTVPGISGDSVQTIPDIQVTAIRLADARILGQASSADILGKDGNAARLAQRFDVRDITEGVALALMEDLMTSVK